MIDSDPAPHGTSASQRARANASNGSPAQQSVPKHWPRVLALESSCDETAVAIIEGDRVVSSSVATQIEIHAKFGGVVPELASRHHMKDVVQVFRDAHRQAGDIDLRSIDALAVTCGPGLVGALLVTTQLARGLSVALQRPLHGIHHMEGHLFSALLDEEGVARGPLQEHVALLASGGHTEWVWVRGLGDYERLGGTRDDAVGEAFDKVAKLLGLGYPGGPWIDRLAKEGDPTAIAFPRSMLHVQSLECSFSGLKTAMAVRLDKHGPPTSRSELADLCASFQAALVDILVSKSVMALARTKASRLAVVGGVAANSALRHRLAEALKPQGIELHAPPLRWCGDNAAMIGMAASARIRAGAAPFVDVRSSYPIDALRPVIAAVDMRSPAAGSISAPDRGAAP